MSDLLSKLETKIPPPAVMAVCAAGLWLTQNQVSLALFDIEGQSFPWTTQLAIAVFLSGVAMDVASLKRFFSVRTTINPLKPQQASKLVTSGTYSFTRNPMYVGLMMWLVAAGIYTNNPLTLIWPVVFITYINRFQIQPEEHFLKQLFGEEYLEYSQNTPRWLIFK